MRVLLDNQGVCQTKSFSGENFKTDQNSEVAESEPADLSLLAEVEAARDFEPARVELGWLLGSGLGRV